VEEQYAASVANTCKDNATPHEPSFNGKRLQHPKIPGRHDK
jgi:hypothetical protein